MNEESALNIDKNTGEVLEGKSVCVTELDELIAKLEHLTSLGNEIKEKKEEIEMRLCQVAEKIDGDGKTRRVAGNFRVVKVVFNSKLQWDQSKLGEIRFNIGEEKFFTYFKNEYKPNHIEIKKLKGTAGEPEKLFDLISSASIEVLGKPSITIEK